MKKYLLCFICTIWCVTSPAQTVFREITYAQALEAARAEGKPVFIDFYTSWCGPCKMMARDVFPQKAVGEYFNENFVCIKLDAEKEGKEQARKYKVDAYPTFLVINANEDVVYTHVGGNSDGEAFVADIKTGVNPELTSEKVKMRYANGERTSELVSAYANLLMKEAQGKRQLDVEKIAQAQKAVDDYFGSLTDEERAKEDNAFMYAYQFCYNPKDVKARFLVDHIQTLPAERKKSFEQTLNKLYLYRIGTLLQGREDFDQSDVEVLKQDVKTLGLFKDEEKEYDAVFRILSAQTDNDKNKYISQLEKDFKNLNVSQKASVATGFSDALNSKDLSIVGRADKWLRSQLPTLDAASIYYAAGSLMQFEKLLENKE